MALTQVTTGMVADAAITPAKMANGGAEFGMRNRIINGAMVIDQRNAGATVTVNTNTTPHTVDRFAINNTTTTGVLSAQQDSSAPAGFVNSLKITTTTADASLASAENVGFRQYIEGYNVADLGWGTANAKTVTLSFWVRSSLTGTFGGVLRNSANDRSYPFTYTISSANTWEQKSVTVAGDTTGTWLTTNGRGILVNFGLGVSTDRGGTAGTWASALYDSATGAVSVVGTLNATWYITGVQLEKGSVATPFEHRLFGQELALCQRYYWKLTNSQFSYIGSGYTPATTNVILIVSYPVTMRTAPTALEQSGSASDYRVISNGGSVICSAVPSFSSANTNSANVSLTTASGLVVGQNSPLRLETTTAYLAWSAEL